MLEIVGKTSKSDIATVYVAKNKAGKYLEFVESVQPPISRQQKWVLIVSTLFGCPIKCPICDAGGFYEGRVSKEEILAQIDYLIAAKYPDKKTDCEKIKIQFARMGEPSLNPAVLDVLCDLPNSYSGQTIIPSVSTIAPLCGADFLARLIEIKNSYYANGLFQMQFSIHSTDEALRDRLIPAAKWNFGQIALFADKFLKVDDKKISLNFALAENAAISAQVLRQYFDPAKFLIKLTPVNPTVSAVENNITSYFVNGAKNEDKNNLVVELQNEGYEVILSIGELEENQIGSNCGQFIKKYWECKKVKSDLEMYSKSKIV